jgi:hypothetical protein
VMLEVEVGVTFTQVKECQGLLIISRVKRRTRNRTSSCALTGERETDRERERGSADTLTQLSGLC